MEDGLDVNTKEQTEHKIVNLEMVLMIWKFLLLEERTF